jgi:predicted HTH domain antitoxin
MKRMLAIQFYLKKKLSLGKAARLAGVTKYEFETLLSENQLPISLLTKEDVMADLGKMDREH